jgi:hypothetical protein
MLQDNSNLLIQLFDKLTLFENLSNHNIYGIHDI